MLSSAIVGAINAQYAHVTLGDGRSVIVALHGGYICRSSTTAINQFFRPHSPHAAREWLFDPWHRHYATGELRLPDCRVIKRIGEGWHLRSGVLTIRALPPERRLVWRVGYRRGNGLRTRVVRQVVFDVEPVSAPRLLATATRFPWRVSGAESQLRGVREGAHDARVR